MNRNDEDRALLMHLLEGDLPEAEARGLRERLRREPALQARLDRLGALRHTLAASRPAAFAPHFSDRVLRRLVPSAQERPAEAFYESLRWLFGRTAVAALLLAGALGTYNVVAFQELGLASTVLEAVLGLPSASLMDALSYGAW